MESGTGFMFEPMKQSSGNTGIRKQTASIVSNNINNNKEIHSQNDNKFSNRLHSLNWYVAMAVKLCQL